MLAAVGGYDRVPKLTCHRSNQFANLRFIVDHENYFIGVLISTWHPDSNGPLTQRQPNRHGDCAATHRDDEASWVTELHASTRGMLPSGVLMLNVDMYLPKLKEFEGVFRICM